MNEVKVYFSNDYFNGGHCPVCGDDRETGGLEFHLIDADGNDLGILCHDCDGRRMYAKDVEERLTGKAEIAF